MYFSGSSRDSIVFNNISIASVIAVLTVTLSVNGPLPAYAVSLHLLFTADERAWSVIDVGDWIRSIRLPGEYDISELCFVWVELHAESVGTNGSRAVSFMSVSLSFCHRGGSRIPQIVGGNPKSGGRQAFIRPNCPENCMKIGPRGPLSKISLCRSATGLFVRLSLCVLSVCLSVCLSSWWEIFRRLRWSYKV